MLSNLLLDCWASTSVKTTSFCRLLRFIFCSHLSYYLTCHFFLISIWALPFVAVFVCLQVEAYRSTDSACHGRFGITSRTAPMVSLSHSPIIENVSCSCILVLDNYTWAILSALVIVWKKYFWRIYEQMSI